MSAEKQTLRVDVISDVVCPWCFVGKRRLEQAIEKVADRFDVQVQWHPFQLNPDMPKEGRDWEEYVKERFGEMERLAAAQERLVEIGKNEGIPFAFDQVRRAANTFDAHRLIWIAGRFGKQGEVAEGLFRANFLEGRDVGKRETLLEVAGAAGLDPAEIGRLLDEGAGSDEVGASQEQARQIGVSGVPFFIAERKLAVSGAQPADVLAEMLEEAARGD